MSEKKRTKKRKTARREAKERRFLPEQTHTSKLAAGLGMLGSLALGAGVYSMWVQEQPAAFAPYLVAAGAAALAAGMWLGSRGFFPVRVGDAGVALERGTDITRVPWCEIQSVNLQSGSLVVESARVELRIPVGAHPKATAAIAAEARTRLPKILKLSEPEQKGLGPVSDNDGVWLTVESIQVAGSRCAESDKLISFERDARLCPNCGQVYHRDHVPKKCSTCDADLTGRTLAA